MKVDAIKCKHCGDIIYSRARHDFRSCSCGKVVIDGGFDYKRILAEKSSDFEELPLVVDVTKQELYDDWSKGIDEFGLIKGYKSDNNKQI